MVVLFAFAEDKKLIKHGLKISFFIIFLFLALRYDYGNDYAGYLDGFYEVNKYSWIDYTSTKELFHYEAGWVFLNRLFEPLGFFAMVAFLAAVNCYLLYRFIKKYVPTKYYWLAIFLYTFTPNLMLIQLSAMRQTVAILIFLVAFDYLYQKKIIPYVLLVLLASTFHSSATILLVVYPLSLMNWKINNTIAAGILLTYISLFFMSETLAPIINKLIAFYFERYEVYQDDKTTLGTGLGLMYFTFLLGFIVFSAKKYKLENALIIKLSVINFMITPLSFIIMMIARIGYYFEPFFIVAIIFSAIKCRSISKLGLVLVIIAMTFYGFFNFFYNEIWKEKFYTYNTIFTSQTIY
jgi:hypothetical protein